MDLSHKISVIVPVYNCEKYLPALIDSVLKQTYRNLEIILIDDGSEDESGTVCDTYARLDSRIRVIHQENGGVSHARNRGLEVVTGEYISFIDSDDTLEPNMYELLAKTIQVYGADIAHCGYKHIVGAEIRVVNDTKRVIPQNRSEAVECLISGHLFGSGLWNKLFRSELIRDIRFHEDLKINEDTLFNFQAFCKAQKTVFVDYALYNYIARFGSSAVFSTPNEKKIKDGCVVSQYIYEKLAGTELNDIATERYIRSLSQYYKYCANYDPEQCGQIAADICLAAKRAKHLGRNIAITVALIRYCPKLYCIAWPIYNKIRKPNWEVQKS